METKLLEDLMELVTAKPVLLADVVATLRGGRGAWCSSLARPTSGRRWSIGDVYRLESDMKEAGFYFGSRLHGAGVAIYVADAPFSEVVNGRGKTVAVRSRS